MKRVMVLILTAVLAAACLATGCGQAPTATSTTVPPDTTDFRVYITDKTGVPLPGVKIVSEKQPEGQVNISGVTDSTGSVTFKNIRYGDYNLTVSRADYYQVKAALTVSPANNELELQMTSSLPTTIIPTAVPTAVTFAQLMAAPAAYNEVYVIVEGYFFSGFEIAALAAALVPASYNPANVSPAQPLVWLFGGIGESVTAGLQTQTGTPSGYPEHYGRVRVTGQFQYGDTYGHMNAYRYQLNVIEAALIP